MEAIISGFEGRQLTGLVERCEIKRFWEEDGTLKIELNGGSVLVLSAGSGQCDEPFLDVEVEFA